MNVLLVLDEYEYYSFSMQAEVTSMKKQQSAQSARFSQQLSITFVRALLRSISFRENIHHVCARVCVPMKTTKKNFR